MDPFRLPDFSGNEHSYCCCYSGKQSEVVSRNDTELTALARIKIWVRSVCLDPTAGNEHGLSLWSVRVSSIWCFTISQYPILVSLK